MKRKTYSDSLTTRGDFEVTVEVISDEDSDEISEEVSEEVDEVSEDIYAIISSTYPDAYNDRMTPEALRRVVDQQKPVLMLLGHELTSPVGEWTKFRLKELEDGNTLLMAQGQFFDFPRSLETRFLLDRGYFKDTSVGFYVESGRFTETTFEIDAIDLQEISLVPVGANFESEIIQPTYFENQLNLAWLRNLLAMHRVRENDLEKILSSFHKDAGKSDSLKEFIDLLEK